MDRIGDPRQLGSPIRRDCSLTIVILVAPAQQYPKGQQQK